MPSPKSLNRVTLLSPVSARKTCHSCDGNTVSYISVTDVGGSLTGYLQNVSADRSQPDGVRRKSVNLAGNVSGSHLVFGRLTAESTSTGPSRPEESHLEPLTDPYVNLSIHTARAIR